MFEFHTHPEGCVADEEVRDKYFHGRAMFIVDPDDQLTLAQKWLYDGDGAYEVKDYITGEQFSGEQPFTHTGE